MQLIKKLLVVILLVAPVVISAQLAKPDGTIATATPTLRIGDADDPGGWAWGVAKNLNLIRYSTSHDADDMVTNITLVLTPDADVTGALGVHHWDVDLTGSHDFGYGVTGFVSIVTAVDSAHISNSGGVMRGQSGIANWQSSGTHAGALIGQAGAAQTYDGVVHSVRGVNGWVGIYGGTVDGEAAAFYAEAPSLGGTISGHNVAYFNENWGQAAFSWYSEGGTLHAETGHANNVGIEVIAAASQVADLQRWLASDESTILTKVDKDGKVTAPDFLVSGTSIKPLRGTSASLGGSALLAGACATNATTVTGATTAMAVDVSPVTYPGAGIVWDGYVSGTDTVTTRVCAILALTPTASTYNIAVIP